MNVFYFVLSFILAGLLVLFYKFVRSFLFFLFSLIFPKENPFRYFDLSPKTISPTHEYILKQKHSFYKNLPPTSQKIFQNRLQKFMECKSFETRKKLLLTDEMKLLVSASAVQLTFGLRDYKLKHFNRIIIYPEAYFSTITKKYHLGEANARGLIVLSWADFKEGYVDDDDKLNLGLHEFAHALFISYQKNKLDENSFDTYYEKWLEVGDEEFFKLRGQKKHFLRKYAGTNLMKFFSVCVEHFFEAPVNFKKELPELYKTMSSLLAQDPSKLAKVKP